MALTVATKVSGVVMTSSPGPIPRVSMARCRAAVHELTARAAGAPLASRNSSSKARVLGPVVIHPDFSESTTSAISSSPSCGGEKGIKVSLT